MNNADTLDALKQIHSRIGREITLTDQALRNVTAQYYALGALISSISGPRTKKAVNKLLKTTPKQLGKAVMTAARKNK